MATVRLISEEEAEGKTKKVYDDIKAAFGMIPDLFKAMGCNPDLLDANWNRFKAIMIQGSLDRKTKELIAVAVSATNSCEYCINAHTAMAKKMGVSDAEIVETMAVADLFNGFNAFANGLQIEPDIKP